MKIYTQQGDDGTTRLPGGEKVDKSDARVVACGEFDELNSHLGVVLAVLGPSKFARPLRDVQRMLLEAGAVIASLNVADPARQSGTVRDSDIVELEASIDAMETGLPSLRRFILPGGALAAAHVQVARSVCRRAERAVVVVMRERTDSTQLGRVQRYLNRLGDWLFVLARAVNQEKHSADAEWIPRGANKDS